VNVFWNTPKELKFYLCVAEGGKGCNIGEPNDDLFSENDSEFVRIQKNYGHPWHSDIKQFDLINNPLVFACFFFNIHNFSFAKKIHQSPKGKDISPLG
jgi:hypothetical protein